MEQGLTRAIFNKDIHSLTEEDISNYFSTEKQETNILEFKAYIDYKHTGTGKGKRDNEKLEAIMESICGFLNSDGGILIWGSPEGSIASGKEKVYQGSLTPVEFQLEPDQLINKISSVISPMPLGILFQSIRLTENSYCYIFEVRKSEFSPHQYKGTYYMRMDGSTRTAPHHYVEALMKKISFPRLSSSIEFGKIMNLKKLVYIPFVVTIHNLSKFIQEKQVKYRLFSQGADIVEPELELFGGLKGRGDIEKNATALLHYNMPTYENYILVLNRIFGKEKIEINFALTVWGELSPAMVCMYKLHISGNPQFSLNDYDLQVLHDNIYLMDMPGVDSKPDEERLNREFLEIHASNFKDSTLYQYLSNYDQL